MKAKLFKFRSRFGLALNDKQGFSLVEVMVAGAVGLVLVYGIMSSLTQQSSLSKRQSLSSDWKNTLQLMNTTYSNQTQCTNMFSGLVLGDATPVAPSQVNVPSLGMKSAVGGAFSTTFLHTGQVISGIKATSITMVTMPGVATQSLSTQKVDRVYLNIQAGKVVAGSPFTASLTSGLVSPGSSQLTADTIELTVYKDPATSHIVSCSGTGAFDQQASVIQLPVDPSVPPTCSSPSDVGKAYYKSNSGGVMFCLIPIGAAAPTWQVLAAVDPLVPQCNTIFGAQVTSAGATSVCRVNQSACPTGWHQLANWSVTQSVGCNGGSTTGCNNGQSCNTGGHNWADQGTESCSAGRYVACGPATSGSNTCSASVTSVGCLPN